MVNDNTLLTYYEYKIQENAQIQNKKSTQYTLTTRHGNSSKVTQTWTTYLKCINLNNLWLKNNSIGTSTMLSLSLEDIWTIEKHLFPKKLFTAFYLIISDNITKSTLTSSLHNLQGRRCIGHCYTVSWSREDNIALADEVGKMFTSSRSRLLRSLSSPTWQPDLPRPE